VNERKLRCEIAFDLDARRLELMLQQRERVVNDLVEIDLCEFRAAGAGEVQQIIDDL